MPKCSNVEPPKHIRPPYFQPQSPCGAESFGWRVSLHMARWQEERGGSKQGGKYAAGELPAGRYSRFSALAAQRRPAAPPGGSQW